MPAEVNRGVVSQVVGELARLLYMDITVKAGVDRALDGPKLQLILLHEGGELATLLGIGPD